MNYLTTKKTQEQPLYSFEQDDEDDATIQTLALSTAFSSVSSGDDSLLDTPKSSSSTSETDDYHNKHCDYQYAPTQSTVAIAALKQLQERLQDRWSTNNCDNDATSLSPTSPKAAAPTLHLDSMMESFDLDLVTQFYDELMVPNFPLEEERDDLEDWLMYLDPAQRASCNGNGDEGPPTTESMDVLILRSTDPDTGTSTIIGGIAFEYYPQARAGLLSYMVVSTDFRRLGILATLHPIFSLALQGLHQVATGNDGTDISAILAETNTTTAGDVSPEVARKRHEILYKLGYRLLEFPYVQPPLAKDVDSFDDIMLLVFVGKQDPQEASNGTSTATTTTIPTQVLHDYVLDFYYSVFGHNRLEFQDHWYYRLVTWYAEHNPTTAIQMDLPPWNDVTPQLKLAMEEAEQQQLQQDLPAQC